MLDPATKKRLLMPGLYGARAIAFRSKLRTMDLVVYMNTKTLPRGSDLQIRKLID